MNWNDHSDLSGKHSILAPSGVSWVEYLDDDFDAIGRMCKSLYSQQIGTKLHEYAYWRIKEGKKLHKSDKDTLYVELRRSYIPRYIIDLDSIYEAYMTYVNDAIGFGMTPEVPLVYDPKICFGTADTIAFRKDALRIHDYKSGKNPGNMKQLETYAALFCLEYTHNPSDISIELRIYQQDNMVIANPEPELIQSRMDKIVNLTNSIQMIQSGEIIL